MAAPSGGRLHAPGSLWWLAAVITTVAVLALLTGIFLKVTSAELAAVFFAVILVFLAEIFNTAIERYSNVWSIRL